MGRLRYIEPELWQNAELRRLGHLDRLVFVYLFSAHADDEGRFRWDPQSILEAMFSRTAPETADDVAESLKRLQSAGRSSGTSGLVLRYGTRGAFGFLTGWFEHQSMHKNVRNESTLPRPPVEVATWADADILRSRYAEYREKKTQDVSYKQSIRWYAQSRAKGPKMPTSQFSVAATYPLRTEGEGEGLTNPSPLPPASTTTTGDESAPACASGLTSPTENGETPDERDRAIADLLLCLGLTELPEGWETMCRKWVGDFPQRSNGRRFVNALIAVEADRIRAGGKRKGSPKLAAEFSRKVNMHLYERRAYRGK